MINFHFGKLPQYRGRFIVSHIILNGETETVVTAHSVDTGIDTGDIIFEEPLPVLHNDTAKSLYLRCTDASVINFKKVLDTMLAGRKLPRHPQEGTGNYYPYEEQNGCELDLSWPQEKIERFIRAVTFEPISQPWLKIGKQRYTIIQQP